VKVKKQRNRKTGETRTVTEYFGNCTRVEPKTLADVIYTPISKNHQKEPGKTLDERLNEKFEGILDYISHNWKTQKLIEDVEEIQNKKVLDDDVEKVFLENALFNPSVSHVKHNGTSHSKSPKNVLNSEIEECFDQLTPQQFSKDMNAYPQNFKFE
jgi:hypothetical protein